MVPLAIVVFHRQDGFISPGAQLLPIPIETSSEKKAISDMKGRQTWISNLGAIAYVEISCRNEPVAISKTL